MASISMPQPAVLLPLERHSSNEDAGYHRMVFRSARQMRPTPIQ
jgi:hypothetical protein